MQCTSRTPGKASSSISRVGRYHLSRTIGKGNFAVVKLGKHDVTKSKVAVKIIDKASVGEENLKKIYREIQILKTLDHPHVIKLYQVMETDCKLFLITEYASGGEVFEHLRKNSRMNEREARRVFRQTISAVAYCHSSGIVHRDLKAENLLFSRQLDIRLVDFGFSNYASDGTLLKTWCGSPPYAAPELFMGEKYFGQKADVWSLGVILYILVCGGFPFPSSSIEQLRTAVLDGHVNIPFYVSADCSDLIRRMLVVNPKQRFSVCQIIQHRWFTSNDWSEAWANLMEKSLKSRVLPLDESSVNYACVAYMQQRGYSSDRIVESVCKKRFDEEYATYYLLCDKLKKRSNKLALDFALSTAQTSCAGSSSAECAYVDPGRRGSRGSITTGKVDSEPGLDTPLISTIDLAKLGMSSSDEEIVSSESDGSSPLPAAARLHAYLNHRRHTALGLASPPAAPPGFLLSGGIGGFLTPVGCSFSGDIHLGAVPYPLHCALGDASNLALPPHWLGGLALLRPSPFLAPGLCGVNASNHPSDCPVAVDAMATSTLSAYNAAVLFNAAAAATNFDALFGANIATPSDVPQLSTPRRRSSVIANVEEAGARYLRSVRGGAKRHTDGDIGTTVGLRRRASPGVSSSIATARGPIAALGVPLSSMTSSSLRNEPYPGGGATAVGRRGTIDLNSSTSQHLTSDAMKRLEMLYQNAVDRAESPLENMRNLQQEFQQLRANADMQQTSILPLGQPSGSLK